MTIDRRARSERPAAVRDRRYSNTRVFIGFSERMHKICRNLSDFLPSIL